MSQITGRALHFVFKIGNRSKNITFFKDILGMEVLRHEEFKEGCEAQCNGPYDNRWSKTMIGYGPESKYFVFELTYNYGVNSYELGNDFGGVTIKSKAIIERAEKHKYPIDNANGKKQLISPDGYKFYIIEEDQPKDGDPVVSVVLNCENLNTTKDYWCNLLQMQLKSADSNSILLKYNDKQCGLGFNKIAEKLDHAKAYGRIAFAVPKVQQEFIDSTITTAKQKILTPLTELDTPGKETVRVIILADPDGHEICFVDEEGFTKLSQVEENAEKNLFKYITKDPFQK